MGKRQLVDLQPYEFVITLIIAEVACIPMNDPSIPFYAGIVPIITLAFLQVILSLISRKSMGMRKILNGKSVIVVDKGGIVYPALKKMNITINDLLETLRSSGAVDLLDVDYAIFQPNGKMCIVKKSTQGTPYLPISLILDGKWNDENLDFVKVSKENVEKVLHNNGIASAKNVVYLDVRPNGSMYIAPVKGKKIQDFVKVGGVW